MVCVTWWNTTVYKLYMPAEGINVFIAQDTFGNFCEDYGIWKFGFKS